MATQKPGSEPSPFAVQTLEREARDPFSRRFQGRRRTTAAAFLGGSGGGGGDFSPSRGMGHYLYHVQYTLLHNHKLFQTLLLSFLKASYAPYPDLPLSADIICRCSPYGTVDKREREGRASGRASGNKQPSTRQPTLPIQEEYSGDSNSWREAVLLGFHEGTFLPLICKICSLLYGFECEGNYNNI